MFVRWKKSSCIQEKVENENVEIKNIHQDIVKVPQVIELISHVREIAENATEKANTRIQEWYKYSSLWSYEKRSTCEKYVEENKDIVKYDEMFVYYETIIDDLKEHADFENVGCIEINLIPLISAIQNHALEWKNILGESLIINTRERMNGLEEIINVLFISLLFIRIIKFFN